MKILFVSEVFYPRLAGGQISSWAILNGLAEKGHEIQVVTGKIENTENYEIINKIEINRPFEGIIPEMNQKGLKNLYSIIKRLAFQIKIYFYLNKFIKGKNIDIIYNMGYITDFPVSLISYQHKIPSLTSIRAFLGKKWYDSSNFFVATFNYLGEILILKAGKHQIYHCPSESVKNQLKQYTSKKIKVIYNPIDFSLIEKASKSSKKEFIRNRFGLKNEDYFLLFVGSLIKVKNIDNLIKVLSELDLNFKLILIGDGPEKKSLEKVIDSLGKVDKIFLAGQLSHEETLEIISACDILIIPSKSETFSNVAIEALALKKIVISTKVGILTEIRSKNIYLIDSLSEINYLIQNKLVYLEEKNPLDRFTQDNIINKFECLFYEMINGDYND